MKLELLNEIFSICKINNINEDLLTEDLFFLSKNKNEISLICEMEKIPNTSYETNDNWKCLKFVEAMDLSLVGVTAKISKVLADNNISIFLVSTYDTDYIFIKKDSINLATKVLSEKGYEIIIGDNNERF